tara:strand:- start:755 stop:868 length:114 start_codon:yes stop_codon:yes gene_type:complete
MPKIEIRNNILVDAMALVTKNPKDNISEIGIQLNVLR